MTSSASFLKCLLQIRLHRVFSIVIYSFLPKVRVVFGFLARRTPQFLKKTNPPTIFAIPCRRGGKHQSDHVGGNENLDNPLGWDSTSRADGRELAIHNFGARFYQICERVGNEIFVNLHIFRTINRFVIGTERKNIRPHKKGNTSYRMA